MANEQKPATNFGDLAARVLIVAGGVAVAVVICMAAFCYFFEVGHLPAVLTDRHRDEAGWYPAQTQFGPIRDNRNRSGEAWQWQTNRQHEWRYVRVDDGGVGKYIGSPGPGDSGSPQAGAVGTIGSEPTHAK